jgi:hypothetical protein
LFQREHCGHWPCHFKVSAPHSAQANTLTGLAIRPPSLASKA